MIKNISKSPIRFDAAFMACVLFFLGIVGSYGSFLTSDSVAMTDVVDVSYDLEQENFTIPTERGYSFLIIEEKDAEEENRVENYVIQSSFTPLYIHTKEKVSTVTQTYELLLLKLKKYILFHSLKLDC